MVKQYLLDQSNIFFPEYRGRLTEGVTYNPSNDTLLWVDITSAEVHRVSLAGTNYTETHEVLKMEDPEETIGAIGLTSNDNVIIICAKYGIAKGDFKSSKISYFLEYNHGNSEKRRLRSNDGMIDPWGNLWVGVMTDFAVSRQEGSVSPEGRLYRIDCHDLKITTMLDGCSISNGLAFSTDGKKFFWTDSLTYTIWKFDYNYISNTLSNREPFFNTKSLSLISDAGAEPDGFVMSKHGDIYTALWGSSKVYKLSPASTVEEEFVLPPKSVTSVTMGGKNNDELYITTAHQKHQDLLYKPDPSDKSGDLGGFLYRIRLPYTLATPKTNTWGGKI